MSYIAIFEVNYATSRRNVHSGNNQCGTYSVSFDTDPVFMNGADANTITYEKVQWDHDWQYYNKTNYGSNDYLYCYCRELIYLYGPERMVSYPFYNAVKGSNEHWCTELVTDILYASYSEFFIAVMLVIINIAIRQFIDAFVAFESFESGTSEKMSFALKIFLGEYLNTGLLSLLIYGKISRLGASGAFTTDNSYFKLAVFDGAYADFDVAWYASVGVSIMFTMWVFIIGTQVRPVLRIVYGALQRIWDSRTGHCFPFHDNLITRCDLQEELDSLYRGPEFLFEVQYASIVSVIWICFTYSGSMPLMNLIAMVSLIALYVFNKVMLLRYYRTPPAYSKYLPGVISLMLLGAGFMHCCFAIWQYSNQ